MALKEEAFSSLAHIVFDCILFVFGLHIERQIIHWYIRLKHFPKFSIIKKIFSLKISLILFHIAEFDRNSFVKKCVTNEFAFLTFRPFHYETF